MYDFYQFPKFCERVAEHIRSHDGFASNRDLGRAFRRHMKQGNELERATKQLEREGIIDRGSRSGSRGPNANGWRMVDVEV